MRRGLLLLAAAMVWSLGSAQNASAAKPADGSVRPALLNKDFRELDSDHNGFLSIEEVFGRKPQKGSAQRKAFDQADRDGNDWLSAAEFEQLRRIVAQGLSNSNRPKQAGKKGAGAKQGGPKQAGKKRGGAGKPAAKGRARQDGRKHAAKKRRGR
jgi:hypothetical protein